jgi:hypothetical protein
LRNCNWIVSLSLLWCFVTHWIFWFVIRINLNTTGRESYQVVIVNPDLVSFYLFFP